MLERKAQRCWLRGNKHETTMKHSIIDRFDKNIGGYATDCRMRNLGREHAIKLKNALESKHQRLLGEAIRKSNTAAVRTPPAQSSGEQGPPHKKAVLVAQPPPQRAAVITPPWAKQVGPPKPIAPRPPWTVGQVTYNPDAHAGSYGPRFPKKAAPPKPPSSLQQNQVEPPWNRPNAWWWNYRWSRWEWQ